MKACYHKLQNTSVFSLQKIQEDIFCTFISELDLYALDLAATMTFLSGLYQHPIKEAVLKSMTQRQRA